MSNKKNWPAQIAYGVFLLIAGGFITQAFTPDADVTTHVRFGEIVYPQSLLDEVKLVVSSFDNARRAVRDQELSHEETLKAHDVEAKERLTSRLKELLDALVAAERARAANIMKGVLPKEGTVSVEAVAKAVDRVEEPFGSDTTVSKWSERLAPLPLESVAREISAAERKQAAETIASFLPKDRRWTTGWGRFPEGFIRAKVVNTGDTTATGVSLDLPNATRALVERAGDAPRELEVEGEIVRLGSIDPGRSVQVTAWSNIRLSRLYLNDMRLTHDHGTGAVTEQPEDSNWLMDNFFWLWLIVVVGAAVAILLYSWGHAAGAKQVVQDDEANGDQDASESTTDDGQGESDPES